MSAYSMNYSGYMSRRGLNNVCWAFSPHRLTQCKSETRSHNISLTNSFSLHNSTFNFIYTLLLQNATVASNVPARCKYALHLHF